MTQLCAREGGSLVIPNVTVKSVGCWDTVGSLGVPSFKLPFFGDINITRGEGQTYGPPPVNTVYMCVCQLTQTFRAVSTTWSSPTRLKTHSMH